jgi:magnesium transporter
MTKPLDWQEELRRLAEAGDIEAFGAKAKSLHPSDVSDVLAALDDEVRLRLIERLPAEIVSEALAEMEPEEHPEEVLDALPPEQAADIVDELAADDAADLIGELSPEKATTILEAVDERAQIERLLEYGEDTAGGIMTTEVVSVPESALAGQAIDEIRRQSELVEDFYQVYCVDWEQRLVGVLPLRRLISTPVDRRVSEIMEPAQAVTTPSQDQEEVARLMARYNVAAMPVVDDQGCLVGRITFDDVIDVVEAERTEDLLRFGGVSADEQLGGRWYEAVRRRLPWLCVNLLTASVSALVVSMFQNAIERLWVLAALAPVVAGMGGNAGTQALAVTVRRVALGLIPRERAWTVVAKELLVGLTNGMVVGLMVGGAAVALGGEWRLGLVALLAMWINLVVAGAAGGAIPLLLERLGADPAVASSVFVTGFTDVCGYFFVLGLASMIVLS